MSKQIREEVENLLHQMTCSKPHPTNYDFFCEYRDTRIPEATTAICHLLERQDREKYEDIKRIVDIQGYDGNWNYDPYMHGMYNGMELILAMLENRGPVYKDAPDEWLDEELKSAQEKQDNE